MGHGGGVGKPDAQASPRSGVIPPPSKRWPKGVSGNPGGHPAGFLRLSQAYEIVGTMAYADVQALAEGKAPKGWKKRVTPPYVKAARMWLGIENVPSSVEIADRTEGKVKSTTDLNVSEPDLATAYLLLAKKRGLA